MADIICLQTRLSTIVPWKPRRKNASLRNKIVFVYLRTRIDHITPRRHGSEMFKIVSRTRDEHTLF